MNPPYPRVLAVDFGERRTGLAGTDYTGRIVIPLPRIDHTTIEQCVDEIVGLCADRQSESVVVGLPLDTSGKVGPRAARTLVFVEALKKGLVARFRAPGREPPEVATVDETATTDEAHERLKQAGLKAAQRKKLADSIAALVILERYLSTL